MNTIKSILEKARDYLLSQHDRLCAARQELPDAGILLQALAFHATRGTLAIVRDTHGGIAGLAIAYRRKEHDIRTRVDEVFNWEGNDPEGDSVYLALVMTGNSSPVTRHPSPAMATLARYFLKRFPEWAGLKQFAHRRTRLVRRDGLLQRLASQRTHAYG